MKPQTYLPNLTKRDSLVLWLTLFVVAVHLVFCVNPLSALIHCILFKLSAFFSPPATQHLKG